MLLTNLFCERQASERSSTDVLILSGPRTQSFFSRRCSKDLHVQFPILFDLILPRWPFVNRLRIECSRGFCCVLGHVCRNSAGKPLPPHPKSDRVLSCATGCWREWQNSLRTLVQLALVGGRLLLFWLAVSISLFALGTSVRSRRNARLSFAGAPALDRLCQETEIVGEGRNITSRWTRAELAGSSSTTS